MMLKVSFLGDISFNNSYNELYKKQINPFKNIELELHKSDFNIGNLECMAKGDFGENTLKHPRLYTEKNTLNLLQYLNMGVVSLAHNHAYDNLKDGFEKTIECLKSQNINFLGAATDEKTAQTELIVEEHGIKLGLLNYVTENTNPKMPNDAEVYLNYFEIEKIIKDIKDLKDKVDHIILLLHWGGRVEEGFYPDFNQPKIARKLIDAGADLIIGSHSHTVQPYEVYKGKHIFYSIGNFCFDDIIQDEELFEIGRFRKRKGILPCITFSKDTYSVDIKHIINENCNIKLNNSQLKKLKMTWRNLLFKAVKKMPILWKIYYFHLKKIVPIKMFFIEANEGVLKKIINLDFKRVLRYIKK